MLRVPGQRELATPRQPCRATRRPMVTAPRNPSGEVVVIAGIASSDGAGPAEVWRTSSRQAPSRCGRAGASGRAPILLPPAARRRRSVSGREPRALDGSHTGVSGGRGPSLVRSPATLTGRQTGGPVYPGNALPAGSCAARPPELYASCSAHGPARAPMGRWFRAFPPGPGPAVTALYAGGDRRGRRRPRECGIVTSGHRHPVPSIPPHRHRTMKINSSYKLPSCAPLSR